MKNKILNLIYSVFLFSIIVSFITSLYLNSKLKIQLLERDNSISILLKRDSLLNEIIDLKKDSTGNYEYFVTIRKDGKILKYNEMYAMVDSMANFVDEFIYNNKNHNKIIEKYSDLAKSYDNLKKDCNIYKSALLQIQERYGIEYSVDTIGNNSYSVHISNISKLDSALVLYPYYKNKILKMKYKNNAIISEIEIIEKKK